MREIVLDTETTGLSVENGHRIVEIGCIELNDQILTSNRFHCYLNPQRKVSEEAFKVHGYSDDFLSDKKKFDEIADDFIKFIGDKKLIIHNAQFDLSHLKSARNLSRKTNLPPGKSWQPAALRVPHPVRVTAHVLAYFLISRTSILLN